LKRLEKAGDQAEKTGRKIQQVPFLLRDNKNVAKYFEPKVVSFGPIHHGKPRYQLAEENKLLLANKFVEESGKGKKAESLYVEIEKKIKQLREYFDEEVNKKYEDDDYLAWMLFVDGCAVLQFIYYAVEDKFKDLKIKDDRVVFGVADLFLLENQLPYQLLEDLMELSENKKSLKDSIDRFIEKHANCKDKKTSIGIEKAEMPPAHLLDRLRTRLLCDPKNESNDENTSTGQKVQDNGQSYRNIQELKAAGIQLKRSESSSLADVSFKDQFTFYPGYIYLPPITVDDSTGPKFLNLIAYEMCPDFDNDFGVTSYICFLDSLIDHPDDVKELRNAHILHNLLGSDKEVSRLFNDIATDLVPNPNTYAHVKTQIQNCYASKWKTWIAQVIHDHFSSPWTIVGFTAAVLVFLLTAIQTWYTVFSP
jgi:phage anti-repressor protein